MAKNMLTKLVYPNFYRDWRDGTLFMAIKVKDGVCFVNPDRGTHLGGLQETEERYVRQHGLIHVSYKDAMALLESYLRFDKYNEDLSYNNGDNFTYNGIRYFRGYICGSVGYALINFDDPRIVYSIDTYVNGVGLHEVINRGITC
jgi:hypothetical protein